MTTDVRPPFFTWIGVCLAIFLPCGVSADENSASKPAAANGATTVDAEAKESVAAGQVVDRALRFLVDDAAKWRKDKGCATCHHGTMTVWALAEAKHQGYRVDPAVLDENLAWAKEQFAERWRIPRDTRPGWKLLNTSAIYFGVMSQDLPVLSREEIREIASHLARHQDEDGAWELAPPSNGPPPTWESRETVARWALLAWEPHAARPNLPADGPDAAAIEVARNKAIAWLAKQKPTDTTQAAMLRLLGDLRAAQCFPASSRRSPTARSTQEIEAQVKALLARQNADGGWGQTDDLPSDAYATGQVLYALSFVRRPADQVAADRAAADPVGAGPIAAGPVAADGAASKRVESKGAESIRPEVRRAIAFLAATQRADGSWPMARRYQPGAEPPKGKIPFMVPITYFGAAWGTLGLVRSVPAASDVGLKNEPPR